MEILDNKDKGLQKRVQKWVQSYEMGIWAITHRQPPNPGCTVPLARGTSMICSKDEQQDWKSLKVIFNCWSSSNQLDETISNKSPINKDRSESTMNAKKAKGKKNK